MEEKKIKFEGMEMRLDGFLKKEFPDYSREFMKKIIASGAVTLNGRNAEPAKKLKQGDIIEIRFSSPEAELPSLKKITVYRDEHLLAINKPAGLLTHPTDSNWLRDFKSLEFFKDNLASLLYRELWGKSENAPEKLGIVHRLDRETSGLMLIALTPEARVSLMDQFEKREVHKTYLGVVSGKPEKESFFIEAPIGREKGDKRLKVWRYGRESLTEISVLKTNGTHSYLEIKPKTGRTNQIRVHLSYVKLPIVGDGIYSGEKYDRLMLHSLKASFKHPAKKKKITLEAEADKIFKKGIKDLLD